MAYRNHYRTARPQPRAITVKYDGKCICCGAVIRAGSIATYYPVGTIASRIEAAIAHTGGLEGNSARCAGEIAKGMTNDRQAAAYVSEGLGENIDFCSSDNS